MSIAPLGQRLLDSTKLEVVQEIVVNISGAESRAAQAKAPSQSDGASAPASSLVGQTANGQPTFESDTLSVGAPSGESAGMGALSLDSVVIVRSTADGEPLLSIRVDLEAFHAEAIGSGSLAADQSLSGLRAPSTEPRGDNILGLTRGLALGVDNGPLPKEVGPIRESSEARAASMLGAPNQVEHDAPASSREVRSVAGVQVFSDLDAGSVTLDQKPLLDFKVVGRAVEAFTALSSASGGPMQVERAGVIASFVLNAAFTPGWPLAAPYVELAERKVLEEQAHPFASVDEKRVCEYLANFGLSAAFLEKLLASAGKPAAEKNLLQRLAELLSVVSIIFSSIGAELESFFEELERDGPSDREILSGLSDMLGQRLRIL